ncbi:MAG TPA: hypothetical protein VNE82_07345 [Candidatus Binataceae bacterium]|nr:hypothetical protein [Candidatus Binataceae bacterium]
MPILLGTPVTAAAGEPDDAAAYQAQYYGPPMPPPPQYPGQPNYAQRNQLVARLNYAEAQYNRARQVGDREAAKHWKKDIKHLRRELSGERHAEGPGYRAPAYMPPQPPYYAPPALAYTPPMRENAAPGSPYAQSYPPTMPPYGYPGGAPVPYPPAGYPPTGYPNAAAASPYGAPAASGSMGGLSSLIGPLLGGGGAPSAAPNPSVGGYPQAGYPNPAYGAPTTTGSMGNIVNSLIGSMRGSGSTP